MKQQLLEMIQVTVRIHTDEFILFYKKNKTGAKTAPLAPKLRYRLFHKTLPRSSAFVNWISVRLHETDCSSTGGTPAAGVIGHYM